MITEIGKSKVRNGNVMDDISSLMGNEKADIFYSDPPWGQGNLHYWQSINVRHNPEQSKIDIKLDEFIDRIFSLAAKYSNGPIFIEYGIKWEKEIFSYAAKHGLQHIITTVPLYKAGSKLLPLHLHLFHKQKISIPQNYAESIKDTYGMSTLRNAVKPFIKVGGIVLDPCCGMGYSAKIAYECGMSFRGNELNKKRLQKTIDFLESKK